MSRAPSRKPTRERPNYNVTLTIDIVTPESASEGRIASTETRLEDADMTLSQVLDTIKDEIGSFQNFSPGSWSQVLQSTGVDTDYYTGNETSNAMHISGSPRAMQKLSDILETHELNSETNRRRASNLIAGTTKYGIRLRSGRETGKGHLQQFIEANEQYLDPQYHQDLINYLTDEQADRLASSLERVASQGGNLMDRLPATVYLFEMRNRAELNPRIYSEE